MRVAVLAETAEGERRVAAVPGTVRLLTDAGWDVAVERGAGRGAFVGDADYVTAGATVVDDLADLLRAADVVLSVQPPSLPTLAGIPPGATLICLLAPGTYAEQVRACRDHGLTAFALELVPRTSRAQAMDVLSSQAMVAGYAGVLAAAERLPAFFPMSMTAAGTVPPARVLVLGAGVAGLQAIATARRLGAVTTAYDVRPTSADEVRSLGATFLRLALPTQEVAGGYARVESEDFLAEQRRLLLGHVGAFDAVITTAAVPGRPAPLLVTTEMVERMRQGSVLIDLAAETGGNCELTVAGEEVLHDGVVVYGPRNLTSTVSRHASELFSRNVANLLLLATSDGEYVPDADDEVLAGCRITRGGRIVSAVARQALGEPEEAGEHEEAGAGVGGATPPADGWQATAHERDRGVRRGTVPEVATMLARSSRVALVPGYGLAVGRAQHHLRELAELLEERGVDVLYALHPVAGRMPGHLNVLLAEAGVPYEKLRDLEQANVEFPETDVALVVGANDVVNPAAHDSPGSPLYGMPILDVAAATEVVVLQRSLRPGFAGVDNPLWQRERTVTLLGDLKDTLPALVAALTSSQARSRRPTGGRRTGAVTDSHATGDVGRSPRE